MKFIELGVLVLSHKNRLYLKPPPNRLNSSWKTDTRAVVEGKPYSSPKLTELRFFTRGLPNPLRYYRWVRSLPEFPRQCFHIGVVAKALRVFPQQGMSPRMTSAFLFRSAAAIVHRWILAQAQGRVPEVMATHPPSPAGTRSLPGVT